METTHNRAWTCPSYQLLKSYHGPEQKSKRCIINKKFIYIYIYIYILYLFIIEYVYIYYIYLYIIYMYYIYINFLCHLQKRQYIY